jgi:hypothetical protein
LRLPGTRVNQLWMGARFVFENHAERSAHYNHQEVPEACVKQLNDLAEYRTKVASAVALLAEPNPADTARNINTVYLQLFLLFWSEHILGKSRIVCIDEAAAAMEVKNIMNPPPAALPDAPPPPPPAPAPIPASAPLYTPPVYTPPQPPPFYYPPPAGLVPHAQYPAPWTLPPPHLRDLADRAQEALRRQAHTAPPSASRRQMPAAGADVEPSPPTSRAWSTSPTSDR